jgi:hypothetical protein
VNVKAIVDDFREFILDQIADLLADDHEIRRAAARLGKTLRASGYVCVTSGDTFGGLSTARSNRAVLNWRSSSLLLHRSRMASRT